MNLTTYAATGRREILAVLALVLGATLGIVGVVEPASAATGCPRPDKASNVRVMQPGTRSVVFPGARSATYCDGAPAYARTQLWPGVKPTSDRTVTVDGVGVWRLRTDGRLSFTVAADYRKRPMGDGGPGHDATMKLAVADAKGHYVPAVVVAFVVYPGASAFPDVLDTCSQGDVVLPLSNDVAGWRGTSKDDKRQAKLRPETLRVAGAGPGGVLSTTQGAWRTLERGRVRFTPAPGWSGTTPPLRYSVQDTFGNTASSTITATTCGTEQSPSATPSATASPEAGRRVGFSTTSTAQESSGLGTRAWVPVLLALLCVALGALALWRRRASEEKAQSQDELE